MHFELFPQLVNKLEVKLSMRYFVSDPQKYVMSARNLSNANSKIKEKILKGGSVLIPFVEWALTYSKMDAVADLITGITIGLIIIPQSVAYVAIVGLSAKV